MNERNKISQQEEIFWWPCVAKPAAGTRLLHEDLPPAEDRTLRSVPLPSLKIPSYPSIFQSHPATKRSARPTNLENIRTSPGT